MTIDLSQFVDKKVRAIFLNKKTKEGFVSFGGIYLYPYKICWSDKEMLKYYDQSGKSEALTTSWNIVKIEEIQMNRYEELEKKVAEMQKEIDRLKAQDQKEVRSFRNDIKRVLSQFYATANHYELYDDFTDKICEVVESYIPSPFQKTNQGDYYPIGFNDALSNVKKNLGLDK